MSGPDESSPASSHSYLGYLGYLLLGAFFGVTLIKSEVVSWYRIQEMFRFHSFHMYGVIGSAVVVAALSLFVLRRTTADRRIGGKPWGAGNRTRYWLGGTIFGLGWGLAGACPGPIYALLGYGVGAAVVVLASALLGARVYAMLEPRLPH